MKINGIQIKPVKAVITPYALGRMANHCHVAATNHDTGDERKPLFKFFLYSVAIELTLKSAILARDCTAERKIFLKDKIGHNLSKALKETQKQYDLSFLSSENTTTLKKLNKYYKRKSFEYFTLDMMVATITGGKDLPEISDVFDLSSKLNNFLNHNKLFINSETSHEPDSGFMSFY